MPSLTEATDEQEGTPTTAKRAKVEAKLANEPGSALSSEAPDSTCSSVKAARKAKSSKCAGNGGGKQGASGGGEKNAGRGKHKVKGQDGVAAGPAAGDVPRQKPKFKEGQRILGASYIGHGELYAADIMKIRADKHADGTPVWQYMLHYIGWGRKWEEWVHEDGCHVDDEAGRALAAEIKQQNKEKRELAKKMRSLNKAKKPEAEPDNNIDPHDVEPKEKAYKVVLAAKLQRRLVDDLDMVEERKLLPLPRAPCVREVLQMFVESNAKRSKEEQRSVEVLVRDLERYFDAALPRILLFSFEQIRHTRMQLENPSLKPCQIYGSEHLLRLLMKMPALMAQAKVPVSEAASFASRAQELLKFLEKNENAVMTNVWEAADTEYCEAHQARIEALSC